MLPRIHRARRQMLDDRVAMMPDGNGSLTEEEHPASLNNFLVFFGDVLSTDEVIGRLAPMEARHSV
jgi:ureidoacrylate peracid hydrolase